MLFRSRSHPSPENPIASLIQEVAILPGGVIIGDLPLVLGFENIFLRPAVSPESDIIFTAEKLSEWAEVYWDTLQ